MLILRSVFMSSYTLNPFGYSPEGAGICFGVRAYFTFSDPISATGLLQQIYTALLSTCLNTYTLLILQVFLYCIWKKGLVSPLIMEKTRERAKVTQK